MLPHRARATDPLLGSVIDDKYTLEHKLGEGGMSRVYRATQGTLDRPVAIKVLRMEADPSGESAERLDREARTLAQLESPHVVRVLDCGRLDSGEPYLVLEYLTGETLAARLERVGPIGLENVCRYVLEAIDGLAAAHAKGVVHRDLKPENLFVTTTLGGDEHIKLLDFGISKHLGLAERSGTIKRLTQPHVSVGSPQYMAPEQVLCGSVDTRADIWALGLVLYELSTGMLPFDGVSIAEVCARIVQAPPAPPSQHNPNLPKAFDELVLKCLEKSPDARPQHVTELATELRRLIQPPQSSEQRHTTTLRLARPRRSRSKRWLVGVCGLCAACPALLGTPWSSNDSAPGAASEASLLNWPRTAAAEPASPSVPPSRTPETRAVTPPVASSARVELPAVEAPRPAHHVPPRSSREPRRASAPTSATAPPATAIESSPRLDPPEPGALPEFGGRY